MEMFLARLKVQAEESPLVVIGIGVTAITVVVQLLNAIGNLYGRRTWSKEVARRTKHRK